jgi:hypothetical protein
MRISLRTAAPAIAAVAIALAAIPASGAPPDVGTARYVVRADPRLCPSPRCGGSWVALANRARTRCHDGVLRPRCYVARPVDAERHPLDTPVPDGALARATIEPWTFEGLGEIGVLVVADVRAPAGRTTAGGIYRLRDNRRRCVRAPCFWIGAALVNTPTRTSLSGLDLGHAGLTEAQRAAAASALVSPAGLYATGRVVRAADGGRELRATGVFLGTRR